MSIALNPYQRSVFGETDGDHYKDMQLIEMQRISVCGVPNPSWHTYYAIPTPKTQETL